MVDESNFHTLRPCATSTMLAHVTRYVFRDESLFASALDRELSLRENHVSSSCPGEPLLSRPERENESTGRKFDKQEGDVAGRRLAIGETAASRDRRTTRICLRNNDGQKKKNQKKTKKKRNETVRKGERSQSLLTIRDSLWTCYAAEASG